MNCIGKELQYMFSTHSSTKQIFNVTYISNYIEMNSNTFPSKYKHILNSADIFIFQPFNKHHNNNPWCPTNLFTYLKNDCTKIKINYYRFSGFWKDNHYKPLTLIDSVFDNNNDIHKHFTAAINKLRDIDNNSDIKMKSFFMKEYKNNKLFHDCFHPTKYFIFEMFLQTLNILNIQINYCSNYLQSLNEFTHKDIIINNNIKQYLQLIY
jgi:hypothetical protein